MMQLHTFALDGHNLCYRTEGDPSSPPILFLHGWYSHLGVWNGTIDALQDRYYCVALDLLGFGDSDKPKDADYTIPAQAERALALADELKLEKFTVIGHSMGGQISMFIASTLAPERIVKLVSVAGVVTGELTRRVRWLNNPMTKMAYYAPFLTISTRMIIRFPPYAYFQYRPWFYKMNQLPFDQWAIDRKMALQPGIETAAYKAGKAIAALDLTDSLSKISAPTLTIQGVYDGTVPSDQSLLIERHVSISQRIMIDDCGHFPMYEKPDEYLAALTPFLDS
jgi:pimeloyl-ACP methyl ester carboxylesterase